MSKFESTLKGLVVTVEFMFLCGLAGGLEFDRLTYLDFILYTLSSLIVATYIYNKAHDWNNSIWRRLK